ncbi:MAG: carboxylating nicotinate-nucleotide diphosphorylase [Actinomycetota bacterium]
MKTSEWTHAMVAQAGLDPAYVDEVVHRAIEEDLDGGVDVTSVATVPFDQQGFAQVVARAAGTLAGLPVAVAVLDAVTEGAVEIDVHFDDGDLVTPGAVLMTATALTRQLLTAERTLLNLLCHLCGIATATRAWVDALEGTGAAVRDTRKTTPGLRELEKYAVRCGGGLNHRMSLSDAALVKDNHVVAAGGVAAAYQAVRATYPDLSVQVECDTVAQVEEAVAAGADLVLLDNMTVDQLREAVRVTAGRARLEASGGLTLANAREVAATGVDFVAVGALTHSAPILDIGIDLELLAPPRREG